ncbi:MAG: class I SAM-dependent methyltransferase [Halothiobacillus sp.]|nr:class I SAM-dependent methyltransferase [Halothiobacillus sp.]
MSASNPNQSSSAIDIPWNTPWPASELERVSTCPVCGSAQRSVLHEGLIDNVFFVAPGKWTLHRCKQCRSAYLDPRPNRESIHLAYATYYTHQQVSERNKYSSLSSLHKLRRQLVNGYTNWRFSTHAVPATVLGILAAFVMPNLKTIINRKYRHMPKLPRGGAKLLDIGCGDGSFLSLARTCGWEVVGLDPDPKAVANAGTQGLTVYRGGIEYFDGKTELFDVITLNHVIEHVHDPVKVLKVCHALLKPGGQLWLATPNIDSFGHARFQKNWRGLETPRHLVLFNKQSLCQAIISAGFAAPHDQPQQSNCAGMFKASLAMEQGHSPYQDLAISRLLQWKIFKAVYAEVFLPSRQEFLCVTTRKSAR